MDNKKNGIPKLRFPGFTGAWEQRKLGDISKTKRGLTYKPSNIDNTGIRVLRSSNIKEDTFVISDNDVFVKESAVNIPFVKNGDILITAANGSTNLVGKHAIIRDIPKNSAVHGGFMLITTSKEYEFLNASMSSNWYKKFIKKYVAGGNGAIGNLRKNDLDNQKIYVPKKDEQEKIGNFFKMLDSLIALHQRKLEHLQEQKKGLLQKMFPKNGETVPEVRFPGFTDAWEQRKLGEVTEYIKGFAFKSKDYKKSGHRIIRVSDLGKDSIINNNDSIFVTDEISKQQNKYKINKNEIIITTVGSKAELKESAVGRPIIVRNSLGYLLNQNLVKIHGKNNKDSRFIYYQLLQPRYSQYIATIQRGNANQANIAISDLWNYRIFITKHNEQQKIGNFFQQLDSLIALHQRKLDHLELMKKGLLQQMFV